MKHLYQTTLLFLLVSTAALAQSFKPVSHWRAGSTGQDGIWDIALDTAGNQYICGYFTGTVDMDPGTGVYNISMPASQTQRDAFVQKLDANGNFLWAKSFGGTVDDERVATRLELDQFGNVYVIGFYESNIRFTSSGSIWQAGGTGFSRPFLVKLDALGNVQWGYGWTKPTQAGFSFRDIVIQGSTIYISGTYDGITDFNPLTNASLSKSGYGSYDAFVLKYSVNGTIKDVMTFGSIEYDVAIGLEVIGNKLLVVGNFGNTIDFNSGIGMNNLTPVGLRDGFFLEVDTAFNFIKARQIGGSGDDYVYSIKKGINTELFVTGYFSNTADLDPSPLSSYSGISNGQLDCFVAKLDSNLDLTWVKTFGGSSDDFPYKLVLNSNQEVYMCGYFENLVDFDPSATSDYFLSSKGGLDGYIMKLDSNGNFMNAGSYGSNSPSGTSEVIRSVAINQNDEAYIVGNFYNTVDVDPGITAQNVTSAGQDDLLFIKLDACLNFFTLTTATACGSFKLPSGTIVTQSGYYLDTVLSSQGCDSTNGITVVLNPLPNATVTQTGATFTAQPGLTYQWINCQSNQPIAGETNQSFTATANGQYAVVVSNGTCIDTSLCIALTNIGVQEAQLPAINLYPNPTTGLLNISSPQPWQKAEVTDLLGRIVLTHAYSLAGQSTPTTELDLSKLPTGIYLVKVYFKQGVVVQRVVKE